MRVLILGLNYAPEEIGIAVYTSGMAEALVAMGHQVEVVAGKPYYPDWKIAVDHAHSLYTSREENGVRVTRCPLYVPHNPTGGRRLVHHLSFALSAFIAILLRIFSSPPDVVVAISPSLLTAPLAWLFARLSGAKAWLHVQDFEIEAAVATGLIRVSGRSAATANACVSWMFRRFDAVSAISPQMCRRLREKGVAPDRIVELNNWANIDTICKSAASSPLRDEWKITAPYVVLYAGTLANKQGLEIVINAARLLAHRPDILFLICGAGPQKDRLMRLASDLPNVVFRDLQPKEKLNALLNLATVHVLPQLANVADFVLPSKLGNMLASGRPIVATTSPNTGLACEIEGCGMITPPADPDAFVAAITLLIDDEDLRESLGAAARRRAESRWNGRTILANFEERLQAVAADRYPDPAPAVSPSIHPGE